MVTNEDFERLNEKRKPEDAPTTSEVLAQFEELLVIQQSDPTRFAGLSEELRRKVSVYAEQKQA
jgi:hypothetical protein